MPESGSGGRRVAGFVLFCLACAAGVAAYIASRSGTGDGEEPGLPAAPVAALSDLRARPHVYYLSTRGGEFGRVAVAAIDDPNGPRALTDLRCERAAFARTRGICLVDNRANMVPPAFARILDRDLATTHTVNLPGLPSRAKISPDERFAAATVFVTGESYASVDFSTRTLIIDLVTGEPLGNLEQFSTFRNGQAFREVDFNFWGVTFTADSNRFYATLATGGKQYLVSGDIAANRLEVIREGVECPSLSPDGRYLAFKHRQERGVWRLHVLELASMREWPIAGETRSVDDQVEWLDNDHVLYRIVESRGRPELAVSIFASPIVENATAAPRLFLRAASSPAVPR